MIHLELSAIILQPVEPVFAYLTDPANAPHWYKNCLAIKDFSAGPVGLGTSYVMVTKAMGRQFETRYMCTLFEPNRRYIVETASGPVTGQGTFTVEAVDGGTRVTLEATSEGAAFFKLAEPLIARQFRSDLETNLSNLKRLLEAAVV